MRDIIFQEIRNNNKIINNMENLKEKALGSRVLIGAIEKMCQLSTIARKEGLLSLEEKAYEYAEENRCKNLRTMIMLIVDGTDPELVEELSLSKYFSLGLEGFKAIEYLIYMIGSLAIQDGQNTRIIEERLLALVPDEVEEHYRRKQDEERDCIEGLELDLSILEKYYSGDIDATPGDGYYSNIKVTDYAIRTLDDRGIQRVLVDVESQDLVLAMKGLSGEVRKRLFDNLSRRYAVMIAEEIEYVGQVRKEDITEAVMNIFTIIIKLIRWGEIVSTEEEVLCKIGEIFEASDEEEMKQKIAEAGNEIYKIMRE